MITCHIGSCFSIAGQLDPRHNDDCWNEACGCADNNTASGADVSVLVGQMPEECTQCAIDSGLPPPAVTAYYCECSYNQTPTTLNSKGCRCKYCPGDDCKFHPVLGWGCFGCIGDGDCPDQPCKTKSCDNHSCVYEDIMCGDVDNNTCTYDYCDPAENGGAGGCKSDPPPADGSCCNDSTACPAPGACQTIQCSSTTAAAGNCMIDMVMCSDVDNNSCTYDYCDTAANGGAGGCVSEAPPTDGSCCNASTPCPAPGPCQTIQCSSTTAAAGNCMVDMVMCGNTDGNDCTYDYCETSTNACTGHNVNPGCCNDQTPCPAGQECQGGSCVGTPPPSPCEGVAHCGGANNGGGLCVGGAFRSYCSGCPRADCVRVCGDPNLGGGTCVH